MGTLTKSAARGLDADGAFVMNSDLPPIDEQIEEVQLAYPSLAMTETDTAFVFVGRFPLVQRDRCFEVYDVRLAVPKTYPNDEPKLFETGGRLPLARDRHVNVEDGSICYEVFEYWLATERRPTVLEFVRSPMTNFFVSQFIFEQTGEWPYGHRAHGTDGLVEGLADALSVSAQMDEVDFALNTLISWPSRNSECPCGSGRLFRDCHRRSLASTRKAVSPGLLARMAKRLGASRQGDERPLKLAELISEIVGTSIHPVVTRPTRTEMCSSSSHLALLA